MPSRLEMIAGNTKIVEPAGIHYNDF